MFGKSTCWFVLMVVAEAGGAWEQWWCDGTGCDISRWSLVYENDDNGATVYGRREDLVTALRGGAALAVYVPRFKYAARGEHIHIEEGHVCVQFWKHAGFKSWMSFKEKLYWWILMLCTSGSCQATRYYIGGGFLSRTNYAIALQWFVKYPYSLRPLLTLDAGGWIKKGTYVALKEALLAGKAVYALMGDDVKADLLPLTSVAVKEFHVAAQSINRVSTQQCSGGRCRFEDKALWLSYHLSTGGGDIVVSRRALDYAFRLPDVHVKASLSWLVDDCWSLALVHNGMGQVIQGSSESLQNAVRAGHRVRVRLPGLNDWVAEADGLRIKNGVISGCFLSLISDDNENDVLPNVTPDHATHAIWMIVSTSGVVRIHRQKWGSMKTGRKTKHTFNTIRWYVDTRPWRLTLSVDYKGSVTAGSKVALLEAVKRGASVRYAAKYGSDVVKLVGADNLYVYGNDVSAQNTFSIGLKAAADNPDDIDFRDIPYWFLTIVTTTGRYEISRWMYGKHQPRPIRVTHLPVDWFILY